ncbi:MAG: hypothetical protein WD960_09335 [Gemmatimonadota bacterium]
MTKEENATRVWADAMERIEAGDHPPAPALARLVELFGVPTPETCAYVAKRLRVDLAPEGRPEKPLRKAFAAVMRLELAVYEVDRLTDAHRKAGARAPVATALCEVSETYGVPVRTLERWRKDRSRYEAYREDYLAGPGSKSFRSSSAWW